MEVVHNLVVSNKLNINLVCVEQRNQPKQHDLAVLFLLSLLLKNILSVLSNNGNFLTFVQD